MQGFIFRIINQKMRHLVIGATFGMGAVTTAAVATSRFHDARFDTAEAVVIQAQTLLGAAVCGDPGLKPTVECERHVKKVQELLARAREGIIAAAQAADGFSSTAGQVP